MSRRLVSIALVLAAVAVLTLAAQAATVAAAPPRQSPIGDPQRGAYLFAANGGCGCHQGNAGFLAGGEAFEGPFGKIYPPNLTSDPETGIGKWSEQDIVNVFRTGKTPQGEQLFPIMPYASFSGLSEQDQHDLAAFIKTAPPVKNLIPERVLNGPVPPFAPGPQPATAPVSGVERGAYLLKNISICSDCHTPMLPNGAPDLSKYLAGGPVDPTNLALNITPDVETGIGSWSQEQIALELKTGMRPNGSSVGGLMAAQVNGGYKDLTLDDAFGIAAYLKSVPPVHNIPVQAPPAAGPPQTLPVTGDSIGNMPLLLALFALAGVLLFGAVIVWRGGLKH